MEEQIKQLIKTLQESVDDEMLELYNNGELEYWDSGNYDDCFFTGTQVGADEESLRVAALLQNILDNN